MYDIIVIGNDLASLIAAVQSSQLGHKTLLLNDMDIPDLYEASGYTFDIDPFPWTGFEENGIFTGLLSTLGIPVDTVALNPPSQLIFPEQRIDILSQVPAQIEEIERACGIHARELKAFYRTIVKTDTLMAQLLRNNPRVRPTTAREFLTYLLKLPAMVNLKRKFSRHFSHIKARPLLKKAFTAELLLFSHLNPDGIAPLSFAYSLARPLQNLRYPLGGKYRIINAMKRKIESSGGIVKRCATLQLEIDDEAIVNIAGSNGESFVLKGKRVIVSTQWKGFIPFLLSDKRCSFIAEKFGDIEPTHYPFTLHLGVAESSIPQKMSQYSVLVSEDISCDDSEPFRENLLFFELSALGDEGRAPRQRRAVSVTAFLKESPEDLSNKELTSVSVRIIKCTETLLPFLSENMDFIDIDGSIAVSRKYQRALNQRYSLKNNPMLGVSLLDGRTPLPNLSVTGGTLFAGLGMEGEIISGWNALHIVNGEGKNVQNQEAG